MVHLVGYSLDQSLTQGTTWALAINPPELHYCLDPPDKLLDPTTPDALSSHFFVNVLQPPQDSNLGAPQHVPYIRLRFGIRQARQLNVMVNAMSDSLACTRALAMNLCTANKHGKKIWY
ncbi:hypothetical protein Agabi119p4_6895 [Agaricus bisporus var. burnettii]|uniref:Uncharacterized protein n=1 Tax=Agaricus bisporus var. burnettii TaxID=192524 RepID=A0A8H7F0D8_AGABI|nr:hypothetical protein Agabi119p4_6895 [Agaricus bisporus var. burnettii]